MIYRIVWKHKNTTHVEYLNLEQLKYCLTFLDEHDDYELVIVEPNPED